MKQSTKELIVSGLVMLLTVCAALIFGVLLGLGIFKAYECFRPVNEQDGTEVESTAEVYKAPAPKEAEYYSLEEYEEGQGPVPEWYRPDEPMSAEWFAKDINVARKDIGCPDWNLCSTLYGWDGHTAEPWELELYARITYLEFWGTSPECCEAGADSILRLWDSGYYGVTLGETLTARAEDGSLVYSPYAYVWDWEYDPDGLADMRELCGERFYNGPEWEAPFFRLWYYHDWAVPCYEIDGVYFSTGWGW